MAQLHALKARVDRLKNMKERGDGCVPCIDKAIEDLQKQIAKMENKDGG